MKTTIALPVALSVALFSTNAMSAVDNSKHTEAKQQYSYYIEQGKTYKDAFQALQYEIAYETAAMLSSTPCKKMIRGL